MSVLEKVVQVIDVLGRASGPMRLGVLAEEISAPKSSAHRLVVELTRLGLVRRVGEGQYTLGYRLVQWGHLADRSIGLRAIAEPVMMELRDLVRESVHLYVRENDSRMCVLSAEGPHTLRPVALIGRPMPLGYGAAGKVLLAYADEATQRRVADDLPRHRDRDLPTAATLAEIRAAGWSVSVDEMEDGLTALAAPISAVGGAIQGAVSIAGATTRLGPNRYAELSERLIDACRRIGARTGA
ncbi:IclR family transcriptional regulator [Nocardia grenadensis]|uniref:IclR family transcriptional regulator n=1 Tax=Nocardia grenadensis TaxID=931537 RepID=UPI003D74F378